MVVVVNIHTVDKLSTHETSSERAVNERANEHRVTVSVKQALTGQRAKWRLSSGESIACAFRAQLYSALVFDKVLT